MSEKLPAQPQMGLAAAPQPKALGQRPPKLELERPAFEEEGLEPGELTDEAGAAAGPSTLQLRRVTPSRSPPPGNLPSPSGLGSPILADSPLPQAASIKRSRPASLASAGTGRTGASSEDKTMGKKTSKSFARGIKSVASTIKTGAIRNGRATHLRAANHLWAKGLFEWEAAIQVKRAFKKNKPAGEKPGAPSAPGLERVGSDVELKEEEAAAAAGPKHTV
ncbi:hypothetical protein WJX74_001212 [Apatococcus lobatus]|uniref:Uncharacterized protein n=1 Tax=Apatococcus lobatus TaxID=904363 RepID=A0AAW1RX57_9CHLO